ENEVREECSGSGTFVFADVVNEIEDWTLHVIQSDDLGNPDVFLMADVTPAFRRTYKRYIDISHNATRHRATHFVRPSRIAGRCHIPGRVALF
ncbi:unnamed protein product, partial [Pylaiella littoralis]